MPRIRSVKPEHWNDKELPNISLQAHLLWIGMWNFSDDDGVIEADPLLIRSQVFPRRTDIRTEQMEQWIGQLVKARFVIPFEYNGSGYYITRTFKTHQKIDKPKPSSVPKSLIENVLSAIHDKSSTNPRQVVDESDSDPLPFVAGEERKGLGEERRGEDARAGPPPVHSMPGVVIFDIEKYLTDHQQEFEAALMVKPGITEQIGREILKKYHLWVTAKDGKDGYPKSPKALIAGFQSWVLNEKQHINGNGTHQQQPNRSNPKTAGVSKLLGKIHENLSARGSSDIEG